MICSEFQYLNDNIEKNTYVVHHVPDCISLTVPIFCQSMLAHICTKDHKNLKFLSHNKSYAVIDCLRFVMEQTFISIMILTANVGQYVFSGKCREGKCEILVSPKTVYNDYCHNRSSCSCTSSSSISYSSSSCRCSSRVPSSKQQHQNILKLKTLLYLQNLRLAFFRRVNQEIIILI